MGLPQFGKLFVLTYTRGYACDPAFQIILIFSMEQKLASILSFECEDILLLFVTIVDVTGTTAQVDKWLVVVRCGGILRILVEAQLTFIQHAVEIDPRSV